MKQAIGLSEKVCDNIFARFGRILPEWEGCIHQDFFFEGDAGTIYLTDQKST